MLKDVLGEEMQRSMPALGVGVQELDDHDCFVDVAILGIDESFDHQAKRRISATAVHEVLHAPLAQQINRHLQHPHAGLEQAAAAVSGGMAAGSR